MRYWGKIIGVMLGIMSGTHIWGVIIGFIIGHAYDKASEQQNLEKTGANRTVRHFFSSAHFKF